MQARSKIWSLLALVSMVLIAPAVALAAPSLKGQTIRMLMLEGYKADAMRRVVPLFERATGAKVVVDGLAYEDLHQKMLIELASGVSSYDVLVIDEPYIAPLAAYLEPLDPLISRDRLDVHDFVPTVWAAGTWDGRQVALPLDAAVQVFFYRADVLGRTGAGVPDTWSEVMDIARKVNDPSSGFYGYALAGKRAVQAAVNVQLFMWSFGGEVFDERWRPTLTTAESMAGLEFYRRLHAEVAPPGSPTYDFYDVTAALQQGNVAMAHQWVAAAEVLLNPVQSKFANQIRVTVVPKEVRRTPMRGVWSVAIPKGSRTREIAWEFIKWLTGQEAGLAYSQYGGGFSPRISVLSSREFEARYPYATVLLGSLQIAKARPRLTEWGEVNAVLELLASQLSSGTVDVQTAATQAQRQLERIVRQAGLLR